MSKKDEEASKPELVCCLICEEEGLEIKKCKGNSGSLTTYCAACGCRMFFRASAYQKLDERLLIYTS